MKSVKTIVLFGLLAALTITSFCAKLYAKDISTNELALDQAYLSHWFSYDSAEQINLSLTPLEIDEIGERAEIRFTSDDGHVVNGLIGYPKHKTSENKIALALHPMGIDQQFWWSQKSPFPAHNMTSRLRTLGYIVISLDARLHGQRGRENFGARDLIKRAHSAQPRLYIDTIIGSVRDYRIVLEWAKNRFNTDQVLAMGYSMGAQMSLLLASYEPSVNAVVAMVPPYVGSPTSPVAPRIHASRIDDAKVLWLAGSEDPHSDRNQTLQTFEKITSKHKTLTWFDAGHRLPPEALESALSFIDSLESDVETRDLTKRASR